jgi:glycine/D-amino acid oxidase-like deaminating enzyme
MNIEETPTWKQGIEKLSFPKLEENLICDVAIVGGGLAGVLTAYMLAKSGKKIVILEKDKVGSGATEYTTAFITQNVDTDLPELVKIFGEDKARLVWQSGKDAIDMIEKIVNDENIDCEFMRTSLFTYANDQKEYEELEQNAKLESDFGFDVGKPGKSDLGFTNTGFYELRNQAKFHPLKFLSALSEKLSRYGVQIYEKSEVTKIKHEDASVKIEVGDYVVSASEVVVATYQPFHNRIRLFLKRGMYKSFVLEAQIPKRTISDGLYQDMDNPYHYFRIDGERMILGGEDVKSIFKIDSKRSFKALEEYLHKILPGVEYVITRRWTGPILEPSDGLPLIGETFDKEFVATAFSGNGMTYSAISSMIISDLILGKSSVYALVYDPKRIPSLKQLFMKGSDYIDEFFGAAAKNVFKKKSESPT